MVEYKMVYPDRKGGGYECVAGPDTTSHVIHLHLAKDSDKAIC